MRARSPRSVRCAALTLALMIAGAACCGSLAQAIPEPWEDLPPFSRSHETLNPYTVGLATGEAAPTIQGVGYSGHRTAVVVSVNEVREELCDLARGWSEISGLQVVLVIANGTSAQEANVREVAGDQVTIVRGMSAKTAAVRFHVDAISSGTTFLVDEEGTIAGRQWRFRLRRAAQLDEEVRQFAADGGPAADDTGEHVLWFDDPVPWPTFPLHDPYGAEVTFGPESGRPRVVFVGSFLGQEDEMLVLDTLDVLRREFAEVEFVWLQPLISQSGFEAMWIYADRYGWYSVFGSRTLGLSLDAYLAMRQEEIGASVAALQQRAIDREGWTVLVDWDYRLAESWLVYGSPSVMVIDAEGRVVLPSSFFPLDHSDGCQRVHPQCLDVLRRLVGSAVDGEETP
ncbi:hypothetical protein JW848_05220 [Candidatus Bipolaricaulota bacterium]|nr:hypothetical protein [Candidatus Bipolaricaulota bacterium]